MKKIVMLFMAAIILMLAVGCGEKENVIGNQSNSSGMTDAQYKEYIKGGTWNHTVNSTYGFKIKFDDNTDKCFMYIAGEDVHGVVANGTYFLSNGVITANYTTVMLFDEYVDWTDSQFRGFQNNVPCTRKYTIVSCSEPNLTLRTEAGETFKFERKSY